MPTATVPMMFIIFTVTTTYNTQTCFYRKGAGWILYIQAIIVCSLILAVYPVWPLSFNQNGRLLVSQIFWAISIFAILILCNYFLF